MDTTQYEEPTKEVSPESREKKNFLEGMALGLSLKGLGEASQAMENATERERAARAKAQHQTDGQMQETTGPPKQRGQLRG